MNQNTMSPNETNVYCAWPFGTYIDEKMLVFFDDLQIHEMMLLLVNESSLP